MASQQHHDSARVHFTLRFRTEWGQRLRLVGSQTALGDWKLQDGIDMNWTSGDNWVAEVRLPTGTVYEYKFVVVSHETGQALAWQSGNNSVLALREEDSQVDVFDNWGGEPGAKLVADGGKALTREQRLLSWANEVEAQMVGARQELRRARMELAAVQEDARKAREEGKKLYARLAESEAARVAAASNLRAAVTANEVLTVQLNEVNTSFRSALETAAHLLTALNKPRRRRGASAEEPASPGTGPSAAGAPSSSEAPLIDRPGSASAPHKAPAGAELAAQNGGEAAAPAPGPASDLPGDEEQQPSNSAASVATSAAVVPASSADNRRRK